MIFKKESIYFLCVVIDEWKKINVPYKEEITAGCRADC
jgi:hypothetical protein